MALIPPVSAARSVSARTRSLSAAVKLRRCGRAVSSGDAAVGAVTLRGFIQGRQHGHRRGDPSAPSSLKSRRLFVSVSLARRGRFHYDNHDQLRRHPDDFVAAYNFARRLKRLRGLTPYEFICRTWAETPERFSKNPHHEMPGLNT